PPVAIASATPLSGTVPLEVSFTGSNSTDDVGITSYSWNFQDGSTSTAADPLHTFTTAGSYAVSLTVVDGGGLSSTTTITIDVTDPLPPTLSVNPVSLDFGQLPINGSAAQLSFNAFNESTSGDDITITGIVISGVNASMFSHSSTLPLTISGQASINIPVTFVPDGLTGSKSATIALTHSGDNSPINIPLSAVLTSTSQSQPLVRISVGSFSTVPASDGGPDWESNPVNNEYQGTGYSVNTGINVNSNLQYASRDASIPTYVDESVFGGLFNRERFDVSSGEEMEFVVPLADGDYTVNLFLGNNYGGTSAVGDRVFDILLEGVVVEDNLDLITAFGHRVAGMLSYPVTVTDGALNISFGHEVENPLINAIEVLYEGEIGNQAPVAIGSASTVLGLAPLEVSFTGVNSTDDVGVTNYLWDFKDGNTSSLANPTHTFATIGTYDVDLTVTDEEGLTDTTTISIVVSDPGIIDINDITFNEGGGIATFNVTLTGAVSGGFSLSYTTQNGTAVGSTDFTITSGTLNFAGINGESQSVSVPISDDNILESSESFFLNLSNPSSNLVLINDNLGEATITDNDNASVNVNDVTVAENGNEAVFTVQLIGNVQNGFTVDYATADDTAIAPADYIQTNGTLNFTGQNGETLTVSVPVIDDQQVGQSVVFHLNLGNLSNSLVTIADAQGTATILDDDSANVSINDVSLNEDIGSASFVVTLVNDVQNGFTIDYQTVANTANVNEDFEATNGTLTFVGTSGETQLIEVTIIDDVVDENNETYFVDLSNISNPLVKLLDAQGIGTIIDNDLPPNEPPVAIASATPLSGTVPLEVSFTGSNSTDDVGITSYSWNFQDGSTSTAADPLHTFTTAGSYAVSLTVVDGGGLSSTTTITIDVTDPLPPTLSVNPVSLDFGQLPINGSAAQLSFNAFNESTSGDDITITGIVISGVNASMFSHSSTLPLTISGQASINIPVTFVPDGLTGSKSATIALTHSGDNSPINIPLSAVLTSTSQSQPLVRISVGSFSTVPASDGGPDWESNPVNNEYQGTGYSVNTGINVNSNLQYASRDASIPTYVDESVFGGLFNRERFDVSSGEEMEFVVPLADGDYTVNLFLGNNYGGTSAVGDRVFDILLEGIVVEDNLDLVQYFGHKVAGMLSYPVTVTDGALNISFGHEVENPLINAIEIMGETLTTSRASSNTTSVTSSELSSEQRFEFKLYPNPADQYLNVEIGGPTPELLMVYDINGRVIKKIDTNNLEITDGVYRLPVYDLESGMYIMNASFKDVVKSRRIIIRH
ncbi:PKD domain-containing protein, partial [Spongiivirga citrea]